jgi:8-oxo-dGTP diphosphatase
MTSTSSKNMNKAPENIRFAIIAADIVLWTIKDDRLQVRLIPVNLPPHFNNEAGLPGGLIQPTETAEQAAKRLLSAKAGISTSNVYLEQLYTFSEVNRDPRGRVVAVAYTAIIPWENLSTKERENSEAVWWNDVAKLPKLAYDHRKIIETGLERIRARITYTTLIEKFMPKEFTLTELEQAYKTILDTDIDKRNFRKKILGLNLLKQLPKERRGQKFRPAKLYSFRSQDVTSIEVL